jgi:hypothetical protein
MLISATWGFFSDGGAKKIVAHIYLLVCGSPIGENDPWLGCQPI